MRMPVRMFAAFLVALAGAAGARLASAQTTQPGGGLLQSLDREVQQLYQRVERQTVRVTVPIRLPTALLQQEHPLSKWGRQLDPKLLQQLEAARSRGEAARVFVEPGGAASRPTGEQAGVQAGPEPQGRVPLPAQTAVVNAEFVGLVLNADGNVLVPLFIDAAYLEGRALPVALDGTRVTTATVVAADRVTALSVIKLKEPGSGEPVKFAATKPAVGSLVLMVSPTRRAARLGVWTGSADDNAIVVNPSGAVAGIVRNGHALYPSMFAPVVEQLVAGRAVKRAALGVEIQEIPADDAQRPKLPALGSRPAARVRAVQDNSAAHRAGIRPGDILLSLGDEPVEDVATFAAAIANYRGPTPLRLVRDGEERTVTVELRSE